MVDSSQFSELRETLKDLAERLRSVESFRDASQAEGRAIRDQQQRWNDVIDQTIRTMQRHYYMAMGMVALLVCAAPIAVKVLMG